MPLFVWAYCIVWWFIQDIIKLGPKPTRKALIALLQQEHNFTDNDLFPGQDVGGRRLSDCIQIIRVINGKFTRVLPAQKRTWRCEDGVWDFTTGKKIPGFPK